MFYSSRTIYICIKSKSIYCTSIHVEAPLYHSIECVASKSLTKDQFLICVVIYIFVMLFIYSFKQFVNYNNFSGLFIEIMNNIHIRANSFFYTDSATICGENGRRENLLAKKISLFFRKYFSRVSRISRKVGQSRRIDI